MNVDRILRLADLLDTEPDGFNMSVFTERKVVEGKFCSSPACVAGWACYQAVGDGVLSRMPPMFDVAEDAADYLFSRQDYHVTWGATGLFTPETEHAHWNASPGDERTYVTPRHAAAVLRHLAKTGVVDWSVKPKDML